MKKATKVWRWAGWSLAAGAIGIALLHTPMALRFLMRLGGCPFAGGNLTPAQMETARHWGLATRKGGDPAPARPALGFMLDSTTLDEVHEWAKKVNIKCDDVRPGFIVCTDVPPQAVGRPAGNPQVDEIALGFNPRGQLVNVTTMRAHLRPFDAAVIASGIADNLRGLLGPATHSEGTMTAHALAQPGTLGMATVSYRYRDYVAEMVTMNLPSSGLSLREHYVSAND